MTRLNVSKARQELPDVVNRAACAKDLRNVENRYLAVACLGALASIGLHSFVDFNLYVPANTMALAWVTGMIFGRL